MKEPIETTHLDTDPYCPFCNKQNDGVTGPGKPEPNDISICAYCHNISIYTKELKLRRPNFKEHRHFKNDPDFQAKYRKFVAVIKSVWKN